MHACDALIDANRLVKSTYVRLFDFYFSVVTSAVPLNNSMHRQQLT